MDIVGELQHKAAWLVDSLRDCNTEKDGLCHSLDEVCCVHRLVKVSA